MGFFRDLAVKAVKNSKKVYPESDYTVSGEKTAIDDIEEWERRKEALRLKKLQEYSR